VSKVAKGAAVGVIALAASVVAYWEGYVPHTYADPIGIPTACYGHTGPDVRLGQRYTREECNALLEGDLAEAYTYVLRCIRVPMTQSQAAALVSATYNAGPVIVCNSTLGRMANRGDWAGACAQLDRWVYAGNKKLRGLIRRRAAERAMCEA